MQEKSSFNVTFSYRLKQAISASGLKQKEIAKRIGVSEITISRYCKGTQTPTNANLSALADVLNVPLSTLVDTPTTTTTIEQVAPTITTDETASQSCDNCETWKRRALAAEERLQRIETILRELFAFARIGQ